MHARDKQVTLPVMPSIPSTPEKRGDRASSVRPMKAAIESAEAKSLHVFEAIDSFAKRNAEVLLDLAKR